jgi:acetate kinase
MSASGSPSQRLRVLVVNAGSSSIKLAVFHADGDRLERLIVGEIEGIGTAPRFRAREAGGTQIAEKTWDDPATTVDTLVVWLTGWLEERLGRGGIEAAGHRVALGGLEHTAPVPITAAVIDRLREMVPLAPMHLPRNLEPIEALVRDYPALPQVGCFDTAFHRTMPVVAQLYGLPRALGEAGARRYGFHGLSYEYIAATLPQFDAKAASGRTVVAHLGSGASMCALVGGKSVATTMGFSPLSGVMMATRPGELDPGLVLWLIRERGMSPAQVEAMLYHDSGLKGVSGISPDMRDLLASDDPSAKEAIDLFVERISRELGSLAAAAGGIDALVFTAGIGENAVPVRAAVGERAAWLGIAIDPDANARGGPLISAPESPVAVWVIPTDEEEMIARHTVSVVRAGADVAMPVEPSQ